MEQKQKIIILIIKLKHQKNKNDKKLIKILYCK